jgi:hypothetical protein
MQEPAFFGDAGSRRIIHQVWDWTEAGEYTLHLYITVQDDQGWGTHHSISEYRGITRQELSQALRSVGFPEPVWLMPAESGYQPASCSCQVATSSGDASLSKKGRRSRWR